MSNPERGGMMAGGTLREGAIAGDSGHGEPAPEPEEETPPYVSNGTYGRVRTTTTGKDHTRRKGESGPDYLRRMKEEALERPASPADWPRKATDLRDMATAIQSDPDYPAWQQNIKPSAFND